MIRGQEEAPIELLIGVTMLTFVLILGFYTYQNTCKSQFEQKMHASLSKFARAVETVYMGAKGTTRTVDLDLSPIGCHAEIKSIRMVSGSEDLCRANIGSESCMVIAVQSSEDQVPLIEVLNVPGDITVNFVKSTSAGPDVCDVNSDGWDDYISYLSGGALNCPNSFWYPVRYSIVIQKEDIDKIKLSGF